jgi:hypothetical protein
MIITIQDMTGRGKSGASAAPAAKNAAHPPRNTVQRKRGTGSPTAAQKRLSEQEVSGTSAALFFFLLPKLQN